MQHTASSLTVRQSPRAARVAKLSHPLAILRQLVWMFALWTPCLLAGCSNQEVDSVREYKVFLDKAKPSLTAMNKARQELYDQADPDKMAELFKDQLLTQISELKKVADERARPEGKLGEIHGALQGTLLRYVESTRKLVDRLKSPVEEEREKAILDWGTDDQKFGKEMTALVNDLAKYLDEIKK